MDATDAVDGPVLVIGASGKTGRAVAAALVARGVPVRAAVRPGRESAAPEGTTAVVVDLVTGQGLGAALTAPFAAYVTKRMPTRALGTAVGILIILLSGRTIALALLG
jgi:nucleoside-diphosphate-sugar epimerase